MDKGELKERVRLAIVRFDNRQSKKLESKRKNQSPEKDLTQAPCLAWMREQGWSVEIYEAKATYSSKTGRWLQHSMKKGTVDCIGADSSGHAVFIEFKAPKKLKTLRDNQRIFIRKKIDSGAFACVVDSLLRLQRLYANWTWLKEVDLEEAKDYLRGEVPEPSPEDQDVLFPE